MNVKNPKLTAAITEITELAKWQSANFASFCKSLIHSVYFKYFLILAIVYILALIPLFRANVYYIDDMGRAYSGYQDFGFSRESSNFLSTLVNDGEYLTDISPYTQVLAVIILALAGTVTIKLISGSNKKPRFSLWYIVAVLPIGLSPYFLENYSFKFDSPYMALSILCSIIPFLFYEYGSRKWNYVFFAISILCTLLMCTTYQPSSGIYLSLALILGVKQLVMSKKPNYALGLVAQSFMAFFVGLVIFKLFIVQPVDSYVSDSLLSISNFIPGAIQNYQQYFQDLFSDLPWHWIAVMAVVVLSAIISIVITLKKKPALILLMLISFFCIGLLSFGLYPFLEKPLFSPRAMYGFFVNFAFIAVLAVAHHSSYINKINTLYMAYAIFICALTYGNIINIQKSYAIYRIQLIANDLNRTMPADGQEILVDFDGDIGYAQAVSNASRKYPILKRLIMPMFSDDEWWWGDKLFSNFYGMNNYLFTSIGEEFNSSEMKLITDTNMHAIYRKGNNVLVELKPSS